MQLGSRPQGQGASSFSPRPQASASPAGNNNTAQQPPAEEIPTINLDEEQDEVRLEDVPF
jgi:hypothetical protein